MTIWFTSDLHIGHNKIRDYCPLRAQEFKDLDHMNTELVRRWNERVHPADTVWCLGDMVMGQREATLPKLALLNGKKILIMGNHDYCWPHLWKATQVEKAARWMHAYEIYFDYMATESNMRLSWPDGPGVEMHHFPYSGESHDVEDRYSDHRPLDEGVPLLHGHVHDAFKFKFSDKGTPMVNVGVDVWDFYPVSETEIVDLLNKEIGTT